MPQPGRYGRRPPKRAPAMQFSRWRLTAPGAPLGYPVAADYLAQLHGGWQVLGNGEAGDCVGVHRGHRPPTGPAARPTPAWTSRPRWRPWSVSAARTG